MEPCVLFFFFFFSLLFLFNASLHVVETFQLRQGRVWVSCETRKKKVTGKWQTNRSDSSVATCSAYFGVLYLSSSLVGLFVFCMQSGRFIRSTGLGGQYIQYNSATPLAAHQIRFSISISILMRSDAMRWGAISLRAPEIFSLLACSPPLPKEQICTEHLPIRPAPYYSTTEHKSRTWSEPDGVELDV